jgi:hypothetical protein
VHAVELFYNRLSRVVPDLLHAHSIALVLELVVIPNLSTNATKMMSRARNAHIWSKNAVSAGSIH